METIIFFLGLIAVVVYLLSRRSPVYAGTRAEDFRQVLFFVFAFVSLLVAVNGAIILVDYIVDALKDVDVTSENRLALGIALTVVGTPTWLLTWARIQRSASDHPEETRLLPRGLYVYLVIAIAATYVGGGTISLIRWALGEPGLHGTQLGWVIVWGGIWFYKWRLESQAKPGDHQATPFRSYWIYTLSLISGIVFLVGLGMLLHNLLDHSYVALFGSGDLVEEPLWGEPIRTSIALVLVGGIGWWLHWLRLENSEPSTSVRRAYVYLFGVMGGVIAFLVGTAIILSTLLTWLFGDPSVTSVYDHFRILTSSFPVVVVAGLLWAYHFYFIRTNSQSMGGYGSPARTYDYLVAGLSLATAVVGLVFLVAMFISISVSEARSYLVSGSDWQRQLSIALTLILVGCGMWGSFWFRIQTRVRSEISERAELARRVHIYSVFGVTAIALLITVSMFLYLLLQDVFGGEFSAEFLRDGQWAIGVILVAPAVSIYFWKVIQEDREVLGGVEIPTLAGPIEIILLSVPCRAALADQIETALDGGAIRRITTDAIIESGPTLNEPDAIVSEILSSDFERVLVLIGETGARVIPFSDS